MAKAYTAYGNLHRAPSEEQCVWHIPMNRLRMAENVQGHITQPVHSYRSEYGSRSQTGLLWDAPHTASIAS